MLERNFVGVLLTLVTIKNCEWKFLSTQLIKCNASKFQPILRQISCYKTVFITVSVCNWKKAITMIPCTTKLVCKQLDALQARRNKVILMKRKRCYSKASKNKLNWSQGKNLVTRQNTLIKPSYFYLLSNGEDAT